METLGINLQNNDNQVVTYLQKKLNIEQTGIFDANTDNAVKNFQTTNGLVSDGIVGGQTWTKIYLNTEIPRQVTSKLERTNNILYLHPLVRTAVVKTFVRLQAQSIPFKMFETFRYPERQDDLYAQGRTKAGGIVTYAKPWLSYHQYGLAVDFVLFIDDNWSWDASGAKANWWKELHQIGMEEGLMRLDFEAPHLQLAGTSSNALKQGLYPPNGDKTWYENFMFARTTFKK